MKITKNKEKEKEEITSLIEEFLNKGGSIEEIPEGKTSDPFRPMNKKQLSVEYFNKSVIRKKVVGKRGIK